MVRYSHSASHGCCSLCNLISNLCVVLDNLTLLACQPLRKLTMLIIYCASVIFHTALDVLPFSFSMKISRDMEVTGWVSTKDSSSLACVQLCRLEKTIFQKSLLSSNNFLLHIVCRNGYKYIIRVFQMQKQKWKLKRKSQEAVVTDSGTLIWWRFWFPPSSIFFPFSQIVGWQNATY